MADYNREQDRNGRSRDNNDPRHYQQRGYGQYARGSYEPRGREEGPFNEDVERRADWRNERSSDAYQSYGNQTEPRRFASPPDHRDAPYRQSYGAQSYGYERDAYRGYGRNFGRGPKNYTRADDRITEDVNDRLTQDHEVDATNIDVKVQNGEVTLSGTVEDRWEKRCAEDCVESVAGVRNVQNNIRVQNANSSESSARKKSGGGM